MPFTSFLYEVVTEHHHMPDPTLGIGAVGKKSIFWLSGAYHSYGRKTTQVNQYMRVDRAPYWKDGAIAVKVIRKGSLSRWSWNTQKCQGKLRNVRKVGVRAEKAREVNLGNEVQKGRQGPDHTGPSRLWWGLLILFSTGTVLSKGWIGHNLIYAKIPSGHCVGNELGVGS